LADRFEVIEGGGSVAGKDCRSEGDSESNMRLADCREASQSLYSVNRVEATVSARARCSGRVCSRFDVILDRYSKELEAESAQEQEVVAQEAKGKSRNAWSSTHSCEEVKGRLAVSVIDVDVESRAGETVDSLNIF